MSNVVALEPAGLSEQMRAAVLEHVSDGVCFVDRRGRIRYWNLAAEQITGYAATEVVGRTCEDFLRHRDQSGAIVAAERRPALRTIADGAAHEARVYLDHRDGHRRPVCVRSTALRDADGNLLGAIETFYDDQALAECRRDAADMRRASLADPLTGVGNRRRGESVLAGWIEQRRRFERRFGILYIDVDDFRAVNEAHGHAVGDRALRLIARTLREACRESDEVIRWGGDEFIMLVADADDATLATVGERVRALVARTHLLTAADAIRLGVSIGGTLAAPGDTGEALVARADARLYESKRGGRGRLTLDR